MILVAGASGMLGGMIARQLIAQGKSVSVLTRDAVTVEPLTRLGAVAVSGDVKEAASLNKALEGVETVITTVNSARRGGADSLDAVDRAGNRNLIDAARDAGVKQFIFISALGSSPQSPSPFLQAKAEAEAHLRASGMPFTIVAPNVFMEVWVLGVIGGAIKGGRPVTLVGEGRRRHSFISVRDVAAFAVAAVGHPAASDAYLALGGPEPLTWRDALATYERALGRPIDARFVPPGTPTGLPEPQNSLLAAFDSYDSPVEMGETAKTFGVTLTTLETVVRESLTADGASPSA